jgi:hypothetical protein
MRKTDQLTPYQLNDDPLVPPSLDESARGAHLPTPAVDEDA